MNKKDRVNERRLRRTGAIIGLAVVALAVVGLASVPVLSRTTPSLGGQVDEIFAPWDKPGSPGCAVAVIKSGVIIYKRGYGVADLDHDIPITSETVFHAASLSKQFTAMSIMLLVGEGRLSLDDDVRKYIQEFPLPGITIGDMLHHISGIRDQWALVTMAGWRMSDDVVKRDDVLELVGRMKALNFEPRTDFAYSNTNYTLAALIVERVSGRSLAEFAREKIFLPLGMLHTRFAETHGLIVHNRAYGYREVADHSFELRMPNYDLAGPTNLLTTVEDLARWDRNFDDKAVGGDAALLEMQTPATLSNGKPAVMLTDLGENANYALGLTLLKYKGLNVVEHNGRDAGYRADLIRFPDQHFAVACLCNLALPPDNLPSVLARRVADVYLADQLVSVPHARAEFHTASVRQRPRANVMAADLAEYTGRYYSDEINTTYNVELKDSSLSITRPKYGTRLLHSDPESRDVFTMSDFSVPFPSVTVTFKRDAHGHVTKFLMDEDGSGILNFQFTKSR